MRASGSWFRVQVPAFDFVTGASHRLGPLKDGVQQSHRHPVRRPDTPLLGISFSAYSFATTQGTFLNRVSLLLSCGGAEAAVAAVKPQDAGLLKKLDSPYLRGGLWQASALLTMYPLDTVKTRLQIPFGAPGPYQRSAGAFAVRRVNAMQPPFWSGMVRGHMKSLPLDLTSGLRGRFPW